LEREDKTNLILSFTFQEALLEIGNKKKAAKKFMKEEHDNRRKWSATTIKKSYYTYRIIDR
jgi:hypothetical protein